ncbi:4,5-dihydroxyphthalate decarboxylase [Nocardia transvalensis]|uniref:4,5-dihydroxyphthalate decarboxylase n=1 Tax=Nocardia transvalensis TaxID=37333 RepID=A0A7W9UMZ3_9NOCA|nr:4,5-dihydroxyphthalate decarboxylase [Nocardia transvalensis]MBB5918285.1 4,5-dihydroxyphthalate decarboxylase [Nocardia transvalensis]
MTTTALTIGCYRYDTTRALFDSAGTGENLDGTMKTADTLPEIFERLLRGGEFDVAELGLTFYLRLLESESPFVALPIFPNRVFRHSCVFVNTRSGITGPDDLVGRTIGEFGTYGQDSNVWSKGILMDEYGFRPERNRWVIGGLERPSAPFDFTTHPHPDTVEVIEAPEGATLNGMLEKGEIDALFSANVPQCVLDGSPDVARLFPDFEPLERDYHRRTGIFPIMHTIVARRDLLRRHPDLAREIYRVFHAAKDAAADSYRRDRRLYQVRTMIPWANALVDRTVEQFPEDWWPYGIAANRHTLETYLRYHYEQGLSSRLWTVEEIFTPDLLDT